MEKLSNTEVIGKTLKSVVNCLSLILNDTDLTAEKLREYSEGMLPRLHDKCVTAVKLIEKP